MRRGDIVTVVASREYGKPRPAVVIQSDALKTDSVLVALLTSDLAEAPIYRLTLEPSPTNGLKTTSQVMVDKIVAIKRVKCGPIMGRIDDASQIALDRMLLVVVGLADSARPKRAGVRREAEMQAVSDKIEELTAKTRLTDADLEALAKARRQLALIRATASWVAQRRR